MTFAEMLIFTEAAL